MAVRVKTGASSWANVSKIRVKTGASSWADVIVGRVKTGVSSWANFFTSASVPAIQSTVTISKSTNGTTFLVTLTGTNFYWSESPTSLTYKFQWSSDGGSSWSDISTGTATNPSSGSSNTYTYSVPTSEVYANINNLYRFSVSATNSSGTSTSTSSTTSIQGPTNVSDLAITSTSTSSVALSWTASTGASAYLLYYSTTPPTYSLGQTVIGTTSGTISGLNPGTFYYFKILPITGTSNTYKGYSGNFSNIVTTTTTALPSPPTITSSSSTLNSITLNFNPGANSTSTRAYIGVSFDGSTTGSSYTFLGLSPGTSYNLQLYGFNGTSQSTTSSGGSYSTSTGPALTPSFGANTSANGGFFGSITNYDGNYSWGISASVGSVSWSAPVGSTRSFTVTGLSSGQSSTVTVTTTRPGYASGSNNTTGTANVITYTVNWNANGGTVSPTSHTGASGTVVTVPTPTRSGFNFLYWASSPSGDFIAGPTAGSSYTITQNITWYARWAVPLPVISTIVARNGGSAGTYNMQWTITSTNTASYTITVYYGATTPPTNTFSNTVSSSVIQTNLGNDLNDYYYLVITPWSGAGGTGSAGVQRTTTIKRNTTTATNTTNNF